MDIKKFTIAKEILDRIEELRSEIVALKNTIDFLKSSTAKVVITKDNPDGDFIQKNNQIEFPIQSWILDNYLLIEISIKENEIEGLKDSFKNI